MTATEALILADQTRPNEYEPELKLRWLAALDGQIRAELIDAFAPAEDCPQTPPCSGGASGDPGCGDPERELLIPWPWDDIYVRYLVMRIDLENGELERYNNDALAFNRIYRSYAGYYAHTHRPVGVEALRF